jgi:DNA polymerase-3 subunit delta
MYDRELPAWAQEMIKERGLTITPKGLALLVEHIGNDLSRIENEIEKLSINLGKRTNITEDDIENYIGVSKEYNIFELQAAMAAKDLSRAIKIIQYFDSNPKAAPLQLVLPSLYGFFSKVFMVFGANSNDEKTVASVIGVNPFFVKDYLQAARKYGYAGVEKGLLLLHQYNLKSIGIGSIHTDGGALLKEMTVKMMS